MRWYRIRDLEVEGVPVDYLTPAGVVRGQMKFVRRRADHRIRDGRNFKSVNPAWLNGWRPAEAARWPTDLPDPIVHLTPQDLSPPPLSAREPHHEAINPGLPLGRGLERPRTRQEAETRYLRWLRTCAFIERHGRSVAPAGYGEAWPRQLRDDAEAVARWARSARGGVLGVLRASDLDDIYIDSSALAVAREKWEPDARDHSDWDSGVCLSWHKALSKFEQRLVARRAGNPVPTFGEIATDYNRDRHWAYRVYERAIEKVWRAAR